MKTTFSLIWVVFFSFLFLGFSTFIKVYINASDEFQAGEEFFAQNNPQEAIVHYERAIRWHIPGRDVQNKAARQIWKIGENYEAEGEAEKAIGAFRILRSGFYSARSFYTPGKTWINRCNIKIAALMAMEPPVLKANLGKTFAERNTEFLKILSAEKSPYPYWSLLTVSGFLGWAGCAAMFIVKGIGKSGQIIAGKAVYWAGGFVFSYGLWILGMANV